MIELRPFSALGRANHGWLDANYHFSFSDYFDPARMQWGALRVWNDDTIAPKSGFPPHPHRDMEIITYVRTGAITHKDSLGNMGRTAAGDVQVMSAGTGITHAEYNLEDEDTTLFQIWIQPETRGGQPSWGAKQFPKESRNGQMVPLASGFAGEDDALPIRAKGRVMGATVAAGETLTHAIAPGRKAYLVLATGSASVNGVEAKARDGLAIADEAQLTIAASQDTEIVLVEVA
jgi:redox-sensitive bicupin YhaK (pirin superfamily)